MLHGFNFTPTHDNYMPVADALILNGTVDVYR
jgi:hypothetical protein